MSASKQTDVFLSDKWQHRAIASEIADNVLQSRGIALTINNQNQPIQRQSIIQRN